MFFDLIRLCLVLAIVALMAGAMGDGPGQFQKPHSFLVEVFK